MVLTFLFVPVGLSNGDRSGQIRTSNGRYVNSICLYFCTCCQNLLYTVSTYVITFLYRPCLLGSNMVNYPWLADSWPNNNLNQSSKDSVNCCTGKHDSTDRYYNSKSLLTPWHWWYFFFFYMSQSPSYYIFFPSLCAVELIGLKPMA